MFFVILVFPHHCKDTFRVLSGEEVQTLLPGSWETSQGETWIFSEDGTLDPGRTKPVDGSKVMLSWSVNENGHLEPGMDLGYEIREVYPNGLALFTNEGKFYQSMWKTE